MGLMGSHAKLKPCSLFPVTKNIEPVMAELESRYRARLGPGPGAVAQAHVCEAGHGCDKPPVLW